MFTLPPTFAFLRSDYQTTLPGRPNSLLTRERIISTTAENIFMLSDDMTAVKICISTVNLDLTFRGPCIVIYSCNKSQQDALFLNFILLKNTTRFGQIYSPSAEVLTLRRLMSYIYGAPILDVSRSNTTTQHSR